MCSSFMRLPLPLLALCVVLVHLASAAEPAPTIRAGAARADITPETAVLNWVSGKPYATVIRVCP